MNLKKSLSIQLMAAMLATASFAPDALAAMDHNAILAVFADSGDFVDGGSHDFKQQVLPGSTFASLDGKFDGMPGAKPLFQKVAIVADALCGFVKSKINEGSDELVFTTALTPDGAKAAELTGAKEFVRYLAKPMVGKLKEALDELNATHAELSKATPNFEHVSFVKLKEFFADVVKSNAGGAFNNFLKLMNKADAFIAAEHLDPGTDMLRYKAWPGAAKGINALQKAITESLGVKLDADDADLLAALWKEAGVEGGNYDALRDGYTPTFGLDEDEPQVIMIKGKKPKAQAIADYIQAGADGEVGAVNAIKVAYDAVYDVPDYARGLKFLSIEEDDFEFTTEYLEGLKEKLENVNTQLEEVATPPDVLKTISGLLRSVGYSGPDFEKLEQSELEKIIPMGPTDMLSLRLASVSDPADVVPVLEAIIGDEETLLQGTQMFLVSKGMGQPVAEGEEGLGIAPKKVTKKAKGQKPPRMPLEHPGARAVGATEEAIGTLSEAEAAYLHGQISGHRFVPGVADVFYTEDGAKSMSLKKKDAANVIRWLAVQGNVE